MIADEDGEAHSPACPFEEGRDFRRVSMARHAQEERRNLSFADRMKSALAPVREDLIFVASPTAFALDPAANPHIRPTRLRGVEGAIVLDQVLSAQECRQIINLTEAMGFAQDAPVSVAGDVRKNLACVWMADGPTVGDVLFERCRPYLPKDDGGCAIAGLGSR